MQQLNVSNQLLDNQDALNAAWERDGYWFFRDVLDRDSVGRLRGIYMEMLAEYGVAERDDPEALYTGASLERFPLRMDPLWPKKTWHSFVSEAPIRAFFKRLLRDEPFWIPTVEYRATPPAQDRGRNRLDYVHQDGFYNQGIPFRICWIPLAQIDEDVGGVILGEGMHRGPLLHDLNKPPLFQVPEGAVPESAWRRAVYRPGDLLMMDLHTPHTGVANYSNRFRLSMDIRVMPASGDVPMIGKVTAITPDTISLRDDAGRSASFRIGKQSFCRGLSGFQEAPAEFAVRVRPGDEMMVASVDGVARVIRDTKN
jgi:hypothetical protein